MIALPLVEKCGITNPEIKAALKRGNDFFSFFIGKGTIPYGDPAITGPISGAAWALPAAATKACRSS